MKILSRIEITIISKLAKNNYRVSAYFSNQIYQNAIIIGEIDDKVEHQFKKDRLSKL